VKERPRNVLFLCTDNASRSLMAEALLRHWGRGRFHAYSAGSDPAPAAHPLALEVIERAHLPVKSLQPKSWSQFSREDAPVMDFVITVCPVAEAHRSPPWPGQPLTAHWGIGDPATLPGTEAARLRAFERAYREIESRMKLFVSLPVASLDRLTLSSELHRLE
jgi:arsenate reductase